VSNRVLCVDDDANILAAYRRQLRKQFDIDTAEGGAQGLEAVAGRGPYAVIVADMGMPGMDGAQFLRKARQLAPDSVRMMLTGNADQQTAVTAVNEGSIFRFLTKPCPTETFAQALAAGIEQHRLITAEKELLEQTLRGSIKVLTEVLALVNPAAFGRATRIQRLVRQLAAELKAENAWQLEVAAMLSQIGCVTIPEHVLGKVYEGVPLSEDEERMFDAHPRVGHDLIAHIPRLGEVAAAIALQERRFDGTNAPPKEPRDAELPLGGRLLKVVLDFDSLAAREPSRIKVLEVLRQRAGWYDPAILDALQKVLGVETRLEVQELRVCQLKVHMVLAEDVLTDKGLLLVAKGQEITPTLLQRLENYALRGTIREPIRVQVAAQCERSEDDPIIRGSDEGR
jgi:response regulator RpfG family c-di-GMP phosphodiesterase